jgi:adenine phosphoribosyltransferase
MSLADSLRAAPILNRGGYPYIVHPLTDGVPRVTPDLLDAWAAWATTQPEIGNATLILAPEAMGIPLAVALSQATKIPFVIARKRQYGLPGETIAYCETGYGESCIYLNDIQADDRIVIADDLISTGGTMGSILDTLAEMGATVLAVYAAVEKGEGGEKLRSRQDVPIKAMHRISVSDGHVKVDS